MGPVDIIFFGLAKGQVLKYFLAWGMLLPILLVLTQINYGHFVVVA
jgi:hypothetical protein